jgi:hypothetical protein
LVALQTMPMLEAAAPTLGSAQEKREQAEINDSSTPAETQVEEAQAMKAMAPASDETGAESSEALAPGVMGAGQETNGTAAPILEGMYAKEAPAPEVNAPGETSTPEGTPARDGFENELESMASPTEEEAPVQAQAKQAGTDLTPPALSENATPATEMVGAVDLSEPASEGQTSQIILRIFEVIFAVTALITATLFFSQRRKTSQ